jgi:hypothetical protein
LSQVEQPSQFDLGREQAKSALANKIRTSAHLLWEDVFEPGDMPSNLTKRKNVFDKPGTPLNVLQANLTHIAFGNERAWLYDGEKPKTTYFCRGLALKRVRHPPRQPIV